MSLFVVFVFVCCSSRVSASCTPSRSVVWRDGVFKMTQLGDEYQVTDSDSVDEVERYEVQQRPDVACSRHVQKCFTAYESYTSGTGWSDNVLNGVTVDVSLSTESIARDSDTMNLTPMLVDGGNSDAFHVRTAMLSDDIHAAICYTSKTKEEVRILSHVVCRIYNRTCTVLKNM